MAHDPLLDHRLTRVERTVVFLSALAALVVGLYLALCPGKQVKEERDEFGVVVKSSVEPSDHKELSLLFGASSLVLFFWGLNGLRLTKLTVGSVSAEAKPPEVKAAEEFAERGQAPKEVVVTDRPEENLVEPTTEGEGTVVINDEAASVYSITTLPRYVLDDLLKHWPTEYEKPKDLSAFEFASKKKGKGNHRWTLKFKDLPALKVSYGGQGKDSATVSVSQG